MRICQHCGQPFIPSNRRKEARFCSRQCYGRSISLAPIPCAHCGTTFLPPKSTTVYCSKSCSNRARAVPPEVRFWRLVDRSGECWEWTAAKDRNGYGLFTEQPGSQVVAHRYAYRITHGEIPAGRFICHSCDNPSCVNPAHLWLGTAAENMHDMVQKGRSLTGERHPARKLSEADVVEIRRRYASDDITQQQLADEYGVHQTHISEIVRGVRWGHITDMAP